MVLQGAQRTAGAVDEDTADGEENFVVSAVTDMKINRKGELIFLVTYQGFEEQSWTREADMNCARLVQNFFVDNDGTTQTSRWQTPENDAAEEVAQEEASA